MKKVMLVALMGLFSMTMFAQTQDKVTPTDKKKDAPKTEAVKPAKETAKPAKEVKPAKETAKPAKDAVKPAKEAKKPAKEATKPVEKKDAEKPTK
ncbi:MAG: hypothetical protein PHF97_12645 [Bacteroidales bacterium]|nr:hypothetical protein [Bacteroidales bacterium]MDD4604634.1 hypothetical protein [Bacteroidales bacterium]